MSPSKPCSNFSEGVWTICDVTRDTQTNNRWNFHCWTRSLSIQTNNQTLVFCGCLGTHFSVGHLIWRSCCCCRCCCCTEGLQIKFQPENLIEFVLQLSWIFRQVRNTVSSLSVCSENDTFLSAAKCALPPVSVRIAACMRTIHIAWGLSQGGGSAVPLQGKKDWHVS